MRYVVGIDGGQTTTAVVADQNGRLLGIGQGGPLPRLSGNSENSQNSQNSQNSRNDIGHIARWHKSVGDAVTGAIRMADLQNARIGIACMGQRDDLDKVEALWAAILPDARLLQPPTARVALYTVTFGRPGVAVLAGMYASAYGVNALGQEAHCGGWDGLPGDEGSGQWIAARALNACCRAYDGIDPPTQLLPMVLRHLSAPDLRAVPRLVGTQGLCRPDVPELAGLAEVVSRAAAQGDRTARRILREAGKELALSTQSVLRRLALSDAPSVTVGTVGGVFRAGRAVLRPFRERIKQSTLNAQIVPATIPPAAGAALIALEALNITIEEDLLLNLKTTLVRMTNS